MNEQPQHSEPAAFAPQPLSRDLLIPASIIIAGACIGMGLYFGGSPAAPPAQVAAQPEQAADTTDQVAEVTEADHVKGDRNADIMIVEYSDFDCPFCSRFHTAMDQIVQNNDDVAWTYRHFPLEQLHPQARAVSIASECAAKVGGEEAFWSFTDGYFEARGNRDATPHGELITRLVQEAGLSEEEFTTCFADPTIAALVQEDIDNAVATGGRGTPWSVIIGPTGKTYSLNGAQPAAVIQQLIQIARDEA